MTTTAWVTSSAITEEDVEAEAGEVLGHHHLFEAVEEDDFVEEGGTIVAADFEDVVAFVVAVAIEIDMVQTCFAKLVVDNIFDIHK